MGFVIEDRTSGVPHFFSMDCGVDFANNTGGWVPLMDDALQFARRRDALKFMEMRLPFDAPNCKILEVPDA